jgi:hypothetical protein
LADHPITPPPKLLIKDRWYWVRYADGEWFPAVHWPQASGGWTNEDCWEDWDSKVVEWHLIPLPEVEA